MNTPHISPLCRRCFHIKYPDLKYVPYYKAYKELYDIDGEEVNNSMEIDFCVEVDDELYIKAKEVCGYHGITVEDAVAMFIRECAQSKQMPLDLTEVDGKIKSEPANK